MAKSAHTVEPDRSLLRRILERLRADHPDRWRRWFEDIEPVGLEGGLFTLRVGRLMEQRYLERECAKPFADAAQAVTGRLITIRFIGPPSVISLPPDPTPGHVNGAAAHADPVPAGEPADNPPVNRARSVPPQRELVLIPDNTFENFVVGPGNKFAHAAAVGVSREPGKRYNPMFIHGGVGLGKTHLLQAVCHSILDARPDAVILYISCDEFVTRFIDAVKNGQMNSFRHHFRDVDVLVIDDIHFLTKREQTQEEFFHTFNALHQSGRQIIVSSDAAPEAIPDLEDRLISRFKWGLVAVIDPPDYETRAAIVKQKARVRGVDLPDDVACLIAARFDRNIRELEGALTRVQMQAHMENGAEGGAISLDVARRALGAAEPPVAGRVTIEDIVLVVTDFFAVSLSNLQSKRRQRSIAHPRQVCMYLARKHTRYSLEEIGGYFGGRDHTTVLHAERKVTTVRAKSPELDRTLAAIEERLLAARA